MQNNGKNRYGRWSRTCQIRKSLMLNFMTEFNAEFHADSQPWQCNFIISTIVPQLWNPAVCTVSGCGCSTGFSVSRFCGSFFLVALRSARRISVVVSAAVMSFCRSWAFFSRSFFLVSIFLSSWTRYSSSATYRETGEKTEWCCSNEFLKILPMTVYKPYWDPETF